MKTQLLLLGALVVCGCRKEAEAAEDWTTYNPPSGEQPADPRAVEAATPSAATDTQKSPEPDLRNELVIVPDAPKAAMTPDDLQFVQQSTYDGLYAVLASQLALEKSTSEPHRRFAQKLIDEHSASNKELADLVRIKGGEVPTTLDASRQRKLDELDALEPQAFDGAYRDAQIQAHEDSIRRFEDAAGVVDDPELLTFAQRLLPTLREHRRELDELHETP
ncbi:MAG: DUF4142 domain-containing protein [Planctomycetes bacterium]|jgi:putative membrane protein|nr:DUF4142 domain-containing protein [Planctomycetota bacterium]